MMLPQMKRNAFVILFGNHFPFPSFSKSMSRYEAGFIVSVVSFISSSLRYIKLRCKKFLKLGFLKNVIYTARNEIK